MLHSSECPVDLEEVAEAYVRCTLPEEQAIAFEDHYATCETCATVLYKTADYVDAMRAAAKTLWSGRRDDLKMVGRSGNS
jgi:anti-sigma factor RsiW